MPSDNKQTPTPHAQAASAYGDHAQKHTPDPREVEARALLKSAQMLLDLKEHLNEADSEAIQETLKYNRQIWIMFYDTAIENKGSDHTAELRSNIINLANFIFKRETDIIINPTAEKFAIIIHINRETTAGLMGSPGN